jgi:hypothetical protein
MTRSILLEQIDADIAEAERMIAELRLKIAVGQSAGEDTFQTEQRVQEILKGWMLLQDQRQKALEAELATRPPAAEKGAHVQQT